MYHFILFIISINCFAQNWSKDYVFPGEGKWSEITRKNVYELDESKLGDYVKKGKEHALSYPIDVTGLLIPYDLFKKTFDESSGNRVQRFIKKIIKSKNEFQTEKSFYNWMGLNWYPKHHDQNYSNLPITHEWKNGLPMGASIIHRYGKEGITFSCAACHSGTLFGTPVLGLTNRFVRANEVFTLAKKVSPLMKKELTMIFSEATREDAQMLEDINKMLKRVKSKTPETLGLDSSSYHVGVSLYYLSRDPYASQRRFFIPKHPFEKREYIPESKPAPWWNLKYKTKWLLDGSVISGNPIATNIIWNEIGRGTDLKKVENWMKENDKKIKELTAAVFATKSPRYEDFFGAHSIDIEKAKKGEKLFVQSCQKCHGVYEKNWNDSSITDANQMIKNKKVKYHRSTPVINVGTDSDRFESGDFVAHELNRLNVLKEFDIVVKKQNGYIPPPLVGIWARWPYFHNNSAPSLCAVLTASSERPKSYYGGHPVDKNTDFDQECNGYPLGEKTPESWKTKKHFFDTSRQGMSNSGHDKRIFLDKKGNELFSKTQKMQIIEFLKTL